MHLPSFPVPVEYKHQGVFPGNPADYEPVKQSHRGTRGVGNRLEKPPKGIVQPFVMRYIEVEVEE